MRFLGGKRAQARSHLVSQPDRRGDRGAAAVEFALVLPLLSLILGGIVSYGAMLGFRPSLSEAAAHGVRAAALEPDPDARQAAGYEAITQSLGGHGITCESGQLLEDATVVGTCAISSEPDCDPAQADP